MGLWKSVQELAAMRKRIPVERRAFSALKLRKETILALATTGPGSRCPNCKSRCSGCAR